MNLPEKEWLKHKGPDGRGALRITNKENKETVWRQCTDSIIPAGTHLSVTALAKTQNVQGKGFYIRLRPYTFEWHPKPHLEHRSVLNSQILTGTSTGWKRITVPDLVTPEDLPDCELAVELVLDGSGSAWLGAMEIKFNN